MRHVSAVLLAAAVVAGPLWAQSKLDEAVEKAQEQLEKGRPDRAIKTLTDAAENVGALGYLALARFEERLGHLDEAAAAYGRARATANPALRPEVLAAAATFALRAGPAHDALALANQAVEAGRTATTLAAKARAQIRAGTGKAALETAEQALSVDPDNVLALVARGEALFALGRNEEAERTLRRAVALEPGSALGYSRLARVQIALEKPHDAVRSGREATEIDESFGEGFAILGVAILAEDPSQWGEAIAQAQQGAFLDRRSPIVQTAVGDIFEANGQGEQAVGAYRRALESDPDFEPARLALIEAELALGHRGVAMEEATKAAAHGPMSPQIQMLRGEMAERDGDHAKAIGYVESALEALPGNARGWALLGRACHFTGRINDAAEAYGRAVELAPRNLHYRATYGLVLGMSGDLDGGLAELEKVVETPGYGEPDGWVNLGWVRRTRNEPAESIAAYRKALEIDPKQAQAALGLGWALTRTKEYDEAIVWTLKAVDLDPSLAPDAYWGVTLAYIYKGDLEKAREFEKKTIAAGRSDPRLAEYIAQLAAGIKDRAEQMAQWEKEQEQAAERARQVEAARNAVRSRNPATRAAGARRLVNDTGGGVDTLIYLIQTDPDWTVRIAAAETLGAFGPAARKAVPHIEGILRQDPYIAPVVDPSDEQINHEMADADLRRALSQALHKIQQR